MCATYLLSINALLFTERFNYSFHDAKKYNQEFRIMIVILLKSKIIQKDYLLVEDNLLF